MFSLPDCSNDASILRLGDLGVAGPAPAPLSARSHHVRHTVPAQNQPAPQRIRKPEADSFWKPRCRVGGGDLSDSNVGSDDDDDDASSCSSTLSLERKNTAAAHHRYFSPYYFDPAAVPSQQSRTRRPSAPAAAANGPSASVGGRPPSRPTSRASDPPGAPRPAGEGGMPPPASSADKPHRPSRASAKAKTWSCAKVLAKAKGGPEVEVQAELEAAAAAGAEALRKTAKQLLLRWHPDKVSQGDSAFEVAKREEAARVLRFVLKERERLGA
eukprot:TRINITY_DN24959_c0_g1_i2.p1 TRINITY_DN24959_c0_g1~~TRINITY_DN24959_c0_g1_i2.p1  ORF type:complete len:271 (-),score=53.46 TRINITY_DN24959_c0_g1_i2:132-944(-)